ncbi:MAG: GtrA family protein [bacterium]|nr:GtrA family protein [bacterium]
MLPRPLGALHKGAHRYLPPTFRQFVKFGITGSVAFVVDFGVYLGLTRLAGWVTVLCVGPTGAHGTSTLADLASGCGGAYPIILANLASVLAAMLVVFLLNKFWTFRDPRADVLASQGIRFFLFYTFTYILNQALTSFFTGRIPLLHAAFGANTDVAAKILSVAIMTLVNFVGNKFLIFRGTTPAPEHIP